MMTEFTVFIASVGTVAFIFLPLIGAQKKSVLMTEELCIKAKQLRLEAGTQERKNEIDLSVSISRSWLFSLIFMIVGPFIAFKNALKVKKESVESPENNVEFSILFIKSLFFSNPITMAIALLLIVLGFALGSLMLFSIITLYAITGDDSKLNAPISKRPTYEMVESLSSIYHFYRNIKLNH